MARGSADWEPKERSAVCSDHFLKEDLLVSSSGGRELRADAVPVVDVRLCAKGVSIDVMADRDMEEENMLCRPYLDWDKSRKQSTKSLNALSRPLHSDQVDGDHIDHHDDKLPIDITKKHKSCTIDAVSGEFRCRPRTNVLLYDIKMEQDDDTIPYHDNSNAADATNGKLICTSEFPENTPTNDVKVESNEEIKSDSIGTEGVMTNELLYTLNLPENNLVDNIIVEYEDTLHNDYNAAHTNSLSNNDEIKVENNETINNDINAIDVNNDKFMCISKSEKGIVIKVEINNEIDSINAVVAVKNETMCPSNPPENVPVDNVKEESNDGFNDDQMNSLPEVGSIDDIKIEEVIINYGNVKTVHVNSHDMAYMSSFTNIVGVRDEDALSNGANSLEGSLSSTESRVNSKQVIGRVSEVQEVTQTSKFSIQQGNKLSCDLCNYQTYKKRDLLNHLKTHAASKFFTCDTCSFITTSKSSLKSHSRVHSGEKPYFCNICNNGFASKRTLQIHLRTHSGEKPYSCNVCNKAFIVKSRLEIHSRTHSGEKPFSCSICSKVFSDKSCLKIHSRTHSGEKPYLCNICNKTFAVKSTLRYHLKAHSGEKPHSCNICNRAFIDKARLKLHLKVHSGEKPYSCNICDKVFAVKDRLKVHMKTHSGEKPYSCNICSKSFGVKSSLKIHLLTHSGAKPHSCSVCNKSFSAKSTLTLHLRGHSGEKPYSCHMCDKVFGVKNKLTIHLKTHSGMKPYSCDICNKAFTAKSTLKLHLNTHAGEKPYS